MRGQENPEPNEKSFEEVVIHGKESERNSSHAERKSGESRKKYKGRSCGLLKNGEQEKGEEKKKCNGRNESDDPLKGNVRIWEKSVKTLDGVHQGF